MTKKEKNDLIKYWKDKPTEELEKEYYSICLGDYNVDCDDMYDRGWCIEDIQEAEKFMKYKHEEADIIEDILTERGVKLWER